MALMGWLKQGTAATVLLGPFVDDTDGKTPETGLTISQADVRLSKNAGNMAQKGESSACVHDELGLYTCALNTTDTGSAGLLTVAVAEAGALPWRGDWLVLPANVYDSLVGGSDLLQVNTVEIEGSDATDELAAAASGGLVAEDVADALVAMNLGGTAQAGAAGSITLASGASGDDDEYNGRIITIVAGTGAGQSPRIISDYVGSTKVAAVSPNWVVEPDATSVYLILH